MLPRFATIRGRTTHADCSCVVSGGSEVRWMFSYGMQMCFLFFVLVFFRFQCDVSMYAARKCAIFCFGFWCDGGDPKEGFRLFFCQIRQPFLMSSWLYRQLRRFRVLFSSLRDVHRGTRKSGFHMRWRRVFRIFAVCMLFNYLKSSEGGGRGGRFCFRNRLEMSLYYRAKHNASRFVLFFSRAGHGADGPLHHLLHQHEELLLRTHWRCERREMIIVNMYFILERVS